MLLNNFINNNQTRRPSENINLDDIYQQVISQQPDEENLFQDGNSSKNVDLRQPRRNKTKLTLIKFIELNQQKVFSSLTQSEKALEIQKIYNQSQINSLIFEIHEIIEHEKQNINQVIQIKPQRKNELKIYYQKLQSMTDMLKQTMGTTDQIKIYISKKVLIILKNIGRFQQVQQYNLLINRLNKIAGIKQPQNQSDNKNILLNQNNILQQHKQKNQNFTSNMIKNQIRRKKKAMTLSLRLQNKPPIEENQQPVTFWNRVNNPLNQDDKQFQQILQRVDSIHEKHLKTWFKHKDQMKQLQQKKKQIKMRYSSLHTKKSKENSQTTSQVQYKRVNKFFSLLQERQKTLYEEDNQLKECFQNLQNQVSKRLNSLPSLNQNVRRNSLKKQHQLKLKIDLDVDSKRKGEKAPLKLIRLQKRDSPIKSIKKSTKSKKLPKNKNKNSKDKKDQDEIVQIKKNPRSSSRQKSLLMSSTEVSIQKSQNKNNSVQKSSNFRNYSPLPTNKNNQLKETQIQRSKLAPLKILNKQKQHKLKIV